MSKAQEPLPGMGGTFEERVAKELTDWMGAHDGAVLEAVVPKAVAYGGADLRIMGAAMRELLEGPGFKPGSMTQEMTEEVAAAFYVLGKVARLFGAYAEGRMPGEDSWLDMEVYSKMALKIRDTGRWV